MQTWAERFPELFAPDHWAWGEVDVRYSTERPPDELISNVHVVRRAGGGIVVCSNDLGWSFLPGGTREPGETIEQLVLPTDQAADYLDAKADSGSMGSQVRLAQALGLA